MSDQKLIQIAAGLVAVALFETGWGPVKSEIIPFTSGPPSQSAVATTVTTSDSIADTCNTTDQFTFTDIGTAMDASQMGVEVGSSIADSTAVVLSDGRVRMYFQYLAKDASTGAHYSAISSDGVNFTLESGSRFGDNEWKDEWWGPHIKAKWLSDGRLRIYKGVTSFVFANAGIISYISSDGLTFTKEDGIRITPTAAGLSTLSHLTIVQSSDSKYRGYFSNMPQDPTRLVKSATSTDLLTWTMDSGVRVGTGAPVTAMADYTAEQPHALQRGSGGVTLFYCSIYYQNNLVQPDIRYSTSTDGVTFTTGYSLGVTGGNGPDIIRLNDGTYLLYYDVVSKTDGASIRVGKIELKSTTTSNPRLDITLSKSTYTTGDTLTATEFRVINPSSSPTPVRLRVWLKVPTFGEVDLVNIGSDGSFSLPGNVDANVGPLSLITITSTFPPRGNWEFNSRITNPTTGAILSEDLNPFAVQ